MKTKKSRERQHKPVKQRNTHQTKTDKTKYKTRLKINWTKTTSKHHTLFFTKQLVINSYMPFYNIIGF
jgi:hypothetical protein